MYKCVIFFQVDDTDDSADYLSTIDAMTTMGMDDEEQSQVLQLTAAILHLGNILFTEVANETAQVDSKECKL